MTDDRPPRNRDVDTELEFHLEMQTQRYEAAGLDRQTARELARQRLGNLQDARAACRQVANHTETQMDRQQWWRGVGEDIRYGWRVLRHAPTFTLTALLTLAVGLGANTAIFSVVNAVLLKSVRYAPADRLALIWNSYANLSTAAVAAPEFADISAQQRAFDGVAAIRPQASTLTGACGGDAGCEPERVQAYVVSPNLFDLLAVGPARGRDFSPADGATGAPRVVLISDALWRRRFGGDPSIVGRSVSLAGLPRVVVGVMPPGVRFPDAPIDFLKSPADVWVPLAFEQPGIDERGNQNLAVLARRRTDVSMARAQADLDAIADTFRARFPNRYAGAARQWRMTLVSMRDQISGDVRPALLVLLGAVGFVLLIACANVANLMLARGSARRRELAVRNALGANRARLVRQLLAETAVLVAGGGALGVLLAIGGVKALVRLDPAGIPLLDTTGVDRTVFVFALVLTAATGVIVGLVPALRQSRIDPQGALSEAGRTGASPVRQRLRHLLVVAEVALAVVVLVASGLLVRSFLAMTRVPLGFDGSRVMAVQVNLPRAMYNTSDKISGFNRALTGEIAAGHGVESVSAVYPLPSGGEGWSGSLFIENEPVPAGEPEPHAAYAVALPEYFATLGVPLVEGRDFAASDAAGAPRVAIIDERLARRHWPNQSALGKRLSPFGTPAKDAWTTVIGVVGHVHTAGPREDSEPIVYLPALQSSESSLFFVARAIAGAPPIGPDMREAVRRVDPSLAVSRLASLDDLTDRTTSRDRFNALLLALFGAGALAIAAVGLYGVMAYLVAQRTREIGIRLALGGRPGRVLGAIIVEGLTTAAAGLVLGVGAALALSRVLSELVFAVSPSDPLTYVVIAAMLLAVALVASYIPARRVLHVDPVSVLRE